MPFLWKSTGLTKGMVPTNSLIGQDAPGIRAEVGQNGPYRATNPDSNQINTWYWISVKLVFQISQEPDRSKPLWRIDDTILDLKQEICQSLADNKN